MGEDRRVHKYGHMRASRRALADVSTASSLRSPKCEAVDSAWTGGEGFTEKVTGELGLEGWIGKTRARWSKVCSDSGAQCSYSLGCVCELPPPANLY